MEAYEITLTEEYYCKQKSLGLLDKEIAEGMYISVPLLARWKRVLGIRSGQRGGKKCSLDKNEIKALRDKGYTNSRIAQKLGVTESTISYHVRKLRRAL